MMLMDYDYITVIAAKTILKRKVYEYKWLLVTFSGRITMIMA